METNQNLAIIGSGASAIYLLKHLLDSIAVLKLTLSNISIFEKSAIMGLGMPYSSLNTDCYHMSNISSEELPELDCSFAQWLRGQDREFLRSLGVEDEIIAESQIYSRLALGRYLNSQYQVLVGKLRGEGIEIRESPGCEVLDIVESPEDFTFKLVTADASIAGFHQVIIATGHYWADEDQPQRGYYASPWPISKLLPPEGEYYHFEIGTLGASLSAFDVVSSLAHRHGRFLKDGETWSFISHPGAEDFKIIMHSANGMLPHLQFAQAYPLRQIYRHVSREGIRALIDKRGFLPLDEFYEQVCRATLVDAFKKDGMDELVARLAEPTFGIDAFIATMSERHDYSNAFEGMRRELVEARQSVSNDMPIHWKEVLDDLVYTLNFHCELLSAEDHLRLKHVVMPFLMSVIAALPLNSAYMLLALYDAGNLKILSGKVALAKIQKLPHETSINVETDGKQSTAHYRMFIDCSGQKALELEDYPFPTLAKNGFVRKARAKFRDPAHAESIPEESKQSLFYDQGELVLHTGGVDIDAGYHLVTVTGEPHARLYDIAFPHTSGVRPYSYGLQACSATSELVVRAFLKELSTEIAAPKKVGPASEIYRDL